MNRVFAYGTLRQEDVQLRVLGRKLTAIPAALPGFKLRKTVINNKLYPLAVRSVGSTVYGEVIDVGDDELTKLDDYETSLYARIEVLLDDGSSAWVYAKA